MKMKAGDMMCRKIRGGKKPLWYAYHDSYFSIVGVGNTADNAIRDFQKQYRNVVKFT